MACDRPLGAWAVVWAARVVFACGMHYWGWTRDKAQCVVLISEAKIVPDDPSPGIFAPIKKADLTCPSQPSSRHWPMSHGLRASETLLRLPRLNPLLLPRPRHCRILGFSLGEFIPHLPYLRHLPVRVRVATSQRLRFI